MKVASIVQTRMGSVRLPKKSLMDLSGKPIIAHLIDRARMSKEVPEVILAIPEGERDDLLEEFAKSYGVPFFRASELDVLRRYIDTAEHFGVGTIVRLTGDNPLVEAGYIDEAIKLHVSENADLTIGKDQEEIPLGFGCEVVNLSALKIADREGHESDDREHVTWYILRSQNKDKFKIVYLKGHEGLKDNKIRLTIDTPQDFELMSKVFEKLYPANSLFGLKEVIELFKREPALYTVNQEVEQNKDLYKK